LRGSDATDEEETAATCIWLGKRLDYFGCRFLALEFWSVNWLADLGQGVGRDRSVYM